jgi:predicted ATPase
LYPSTPLQGPAKSRMHYNDFVRRVHETCHAYRQATARIIKEGGNGSGRLVPHSEDAVPYAARSFVETHGWLLCFDEFQVPDPADSVIIGRMLGFMMEHGAVIVATSNRSIDELAGTLFDRHLFTPFARIMADRCDNVSLDAGVDFRARAAEEAGRLGPEHLSPLPAYTSDRAAFDDAWRCAVAAEVAGPGQELGNGDGANASQDRETDGTAACEIPAFSVGYGRTIRVPASCGGSAQFDFRGLLTAALGASDYARIAERFHTVFVSDVPALNLGSRDAARRLITLVDELYERRCRLVLHGAVDMPSLFEGDRGEVDAMSIDDGIVEFLTPEQLESSLFTGEDEVFAFRRCLSRLAEMGTRAYWHAGEGRPY